MYGTVLTYLMPLICEQGKKHTSTTLASCILFILNILYCHHINFRLQNLMSLNLPRDNDLYKNLQSLPNTGDKESKQWLITHSKCPSFLMQNTPLRKERPLVRSSMGQKGELEYMFFEMFFVFP